MEKRTDLAMEERELWQRDAEKTARLHGVAAGERKGRGITVTTVKILDERGAAALHKPVGKYVTLQWEKNLLRSPRGFRTAAEQLGKAACSMIPRGDVLVVGLGNAAVTPDAVGPRTLDHLVVSRHLRQFFPKLRQVSAIAPGVLGTTGMESLEVVRGLMKSIAPACVVVVDALASCSVDRLCGCVQLTDTGIVPGSGVGNTRCAFTQRTLGVPVVAIGVPTVLTARSAVEQILKKHGGALENQQALPEPSFIISLQDMDSRIASVARLLGFGISLGLHRGMTTDDVSCFVG